VIMGRKPAVSPSGLVLSFMWRNTEGKRERPDCAARRADIGELKTARSPSRLAVGRSLTPAHPRGALQILVKCSAPLDMDRLVRSVV
jgi:hypothetical protein